MGKGTRSWTPAQHRKFKATMKARSRVSLPKRLGAGAARPQVEVVALLRQAERAANKALRQGSIKHLDQAHLLSMIALRTLEGNS